MVRLKPNIAEAFPNAETVNEASDEARLDQWARNLNHMQQAPLPKRIFDFT
jgi:hypothetical protein